MPIETRIERARGCGYRKPGGLYMVGSPGIPCGRLPIELTVCPCCNAGIKPARGWTWISSEILQSECKLERDCMGCGLKLPKKIGLIWVGGIFYKSPAAFMKEAHMAGISRRISGVPKGFKIGEDYVVLAHRRAIVDYSEKNPKFKAGVFCVFKPTAIEYIVKGTETDEELFNLEERGLTLVKVIKDTETQMSTEDQLINFTIKYGIEEEGVKKVRIFDLRAISKTKAKAAFLALRPGAKIISAKPVK